MFLAPVEWDMTLYLPMALAREGLRFNISSSPVLDAFPLGNTTGTAQSIARGAPQVPEPVPRQLPWGMAQGGPRMWHPEVAVVSCGAGTLEEVGRGSRAAGDREAKSIARGESRGSEMGQHMPYQKVDTQTEQKRF